jgi:hypothetical protein
VQKVLRNRIPRDALFRLSPAKNSHLYIIAPLIKPSAVLAVFLPANCVVLLAGVSKAAASALFGSKKPRQSSRKV